MEYIKLKDVLHILDLVMPDEEIRRKGKTIRKRLKELPTVGFKHGQWVQKSPRFGSHYELYACSCCGFTYTFKPDYKFCPNCGADMREGAEG